MKAKHIRSAATMLSVVIAAALFATFATRYVTFLAGLENVASDVRVAALQPSQVPSKDIVIAAITEDTVSRFPYRSPVDREFLANLLLELERKGARLIALDVLLDQATEPTKDDHLKKTLLAIKVPLLVSYTDTPSIVDSDQLRYLNDFVPFKLRGAANLATDPFDGTVRWIYLGADGPEKPKGFARKAAELLGLTTPAEQVEIAWKPPQDALTPAFPIFPSHAVTALPDEWFAGKTVLVGAILSITDRHRTPMASVYDDERGHMAGVVVQAHSLAQYLEGRQPLKLATQWALLTSIVLALCGLLIGLLKKGLVFNALSGITLITVFWLVGMVGFRYGLPMLPLVGPTLALALSLWIMDVLLGSAERQQRQFIQGAFSRYVSPIVVEQLVDNPESLSISGERRELTFIFTDIAGFTTLSEKLSAEKLSEVLNAYLDGACTIILRHGGMIDKFIGDAIMSIFNAPLPQPDHVARAVRCALELDAYAEDFRIAQNKAGIPIGQTRLGIHSGPAVMGNFGSQSRMDFTALGDTVNTAARTEGVNKYFGTRLCCTDVVVAQCPEMHFRPIGDVVLKGKLTGVELFSPASDADTATGLFSRYVDVYALLKNSNAMAPDAVRALHQDFPEDALTTFHFERVESGLNTHHVVMEDK
jgi:class 3 adenylate cyclase/CHASE2 domain-containing sensor protein